MVVRNTARLDLIQCIDKLIPLVPGGDNMVDLHSNLVTHAPTHVSIDTDINGYYITAPDSYFSANPRLVQTKFFDYNSGDFANSTTDPKVVALGWLLAVLEHTAVKALEAK